MLVKLVDVTRDHFNRFEYVQIIWKTRRHDVSITIFIQSRPRNAASGNTYYYIVTLTCYVFPVGSVVAGSQSVVSHSKTLQAM